MAEDEITETGTETEPQAQPDPGPDLAKEVEKWKALSRKNERALEAERAKGLSEAERAISEAKAAGRTEAIQEAGRRLARAEIRAAAAGKGLDVAALLDDVDLTRFVGEDGEPDDKAIAKAIDRWAGIAKRKGDADQGYRPGQRKQDMNTWMRQQVGIQQ